jgi:C-terminal processing protease CtpA/Prc
VNIVGNKANHLPGLRWEWVENELVITYVGDSSLGLRRGDLVKQINGRPAKTHFEAVHPLISYGTKGWLDYRANTESLLGEKGSVMELEVVRATGEKANVKTTRSLTLMQYNAMRPAEDSIKMLRDDVAYLNIGKASMKAINEALPQLKKSRLIICDLRGYPNGNHEFLTYLLKEKDTSTRWMQVAHTIYPDRENIADWQHFGWSMTPAKTHLDAKVIFLIDGQAISYAESYMGFVEHYQLATIIGQPTAGANGNINPFTLPGGYTISWTGMRVVKHNGSTHHTVGIQPHIRVEKTIKGVQEGRDEFLEKALEVGKKEF